MAAQRNIFVSVSRAGLTFAAALGLARVFSGGSWVIPMLVAAAIPPAVLAYMDHRRHNPLWGVAIATVIGVWLAIVLDDPSETVAGIPTRAAVSNFAHDLGRSPHILRSAVVPVEPVGSALLLSFVAVFAAALAAYVIARHLDAPMGAIGPSVALYVAIAALGSGPWAATTACYSLVLIAYLVALNYDEVSARRTWFQSRRARHSQMVTGGIVVGALAVACAIAVGPLFPGARGAAWINYRQLGRGPGASVLNAPSPLLSIATKLSRDAETEIFTVETSDGEAYRWRAIALDSFTGTNDQWGLDAKQTSTSELQRPSGAPDAVRVAQNVHINAAVDPYWLPAAYRPFRIDLPDAAVLPASATLFLPKGSVAGVTYRVESEVRLPSEAELRSVTEGEMATRPADTELPGNFPDRVRELAEEIVRHAPTPYDRALALEQFFQGDDFTYDQSVDYSSSPRALEEFVFERRRGFCEQFAAAYAEMARSLDLPTRLAVGYQPGTPDINGILHVKGADAHAWPEVWLGERIGWYPFEPTKGRSDPVTGRGGPAGPDSTTPTTNPAPTTVPTPTSTPSATTPSPFDPDSVRVAPPPGSSGRPQTGSRVLAGIVAAIVVAILAGVALLVTLAVRAARRTHRRRFAPDTRVRVLGAWNEALERLRAAGVVPRPSATSIEFALRHAPAHGAGVAGPPLMGLARLHSAAMFAPDPPSEADADSAWGHVDAIEAALRDSVPRSERWVTRLRIRRRDRGSSGR